MRLAPIAVTSGDPSGIGPEIAVAARTILGDALPFFLIADPRHLPPGSPVRLIATPAEAATGPAHLLPLLPHLFAAPAHPGAPDPANAQAVIDVIARAVALVQSGQACAVTTNPIHKKALKDGAGFAYPGHTEFLAALAGGGPVVMLLACDALRVVPVTIHIPLADVPRTLTADLLETTLRITAAPWRASIAAVYSTEW